MTVGAVEEEHGSLGRPTVDVTELECGTIGKSPVSWDDEDGISKTCAVLGGGATESSDCEKLDSGGGTSCACEDFSIEDTEMFATDEFEAREVGIAFEAGELHSVADTVSKVLIEDLRWSLDTSEICIEEHEMEADIGN